LYAPWPDSHAIPAFSRTKDPEKPHALNCRHPHPETAAIAKPNYSFEKRQREIAKKKKQDEKLARKQAAKETVPRPEDSPARDDTSGRS
jgi:hypothetical protein